MTGTVGDNAMVALLGAHGHPFGASDFWRKQSEVQAVLASHEWPTDKTH